MIEIKNVTKKYGDFTAIEDITLTIPNSSIYGLVGYNGAGKTTLLKVAAGVIKAESGEVLYDNENVYDNAKVRENLFYVPDNFYTLSGASLKRMGKFYKGYYPNFSDEVFNKMIDIMNIDASKNISSFSKGMQRQAQVILAMSTMPKYLLFDEVFDGIDPSKRNLLKKLFINYMSQSECSILMSSHNLIEIADMCDHVALINGKKLQLDISADEASSAYVKYRLIFNESVDESIFANIENKGIVADGRLATIIVSSSFDENVFKSLGAIHIDAINLSLEELILNEMEDRNCDISKIFC